MPLPLLSLLLLLLLLLLLFLLLTEQVDFHTPLSSSHFLFAMRTDSLVNPSRAFNSASNLLVCSWVRTSVEGSRMKKKNPLSPEILKKRSAACVRGWCACFGHFGRSTLVVLACQRGDLGESSSPGCPSTCWRCCFIISESFLFLPRLFSPAVSGFSPAAAVIRRWRGRACCLCVHLW